MPLLDTEYTKNQVHEPMSTDMLSGATELLLLLDLLVLQLSGECRRCPLYH